MRILLLTPAELTRDPRARRQVAAAREAGSDVAGVCRAVGGRPVDLGLDVRRVLPTWLETKLRRSAPAGADDLRRSALLREIRGLLRLLRLGTDTIRLARAGLAVGSAEIVHANDLDTLPAAALIARRRGARLVYDAHEVYSDFESDPPRLASMVLRRLEATLARRAEAVVTVSPQMGDELERRLRPAKRPLVVLNAPELDPTEPRLDPRSGPLRAVYLAAVGPARAIGDLLDALALAPDVELTLRVMGADPEPLLVEAKKRGVEGRLRMECPVPPDEIVTSLRDFEVGLVIDTRLALNNDLTIPNKLFEYLMAGVAVVASRLPAISSLLEGERLGLTYAPGDAADLANVLQRLASDRELLDNLRRRARRAAVSTYNAESQRPTLLEAWGLSS